MHTLTNYRQGEVLIFGVKTEKRRSSPGCGHGHYGQPTNYKELIKKAKPVPDNVIIEGEISGHKHEVKNGRLYDHPDKKGVMILEAGDGCVVIHPEHKPIAVKKGVYEIEIQREYSEGKAAKVKD